MLPTIALVGRPNVGKSTLFNRLIGQRQAIIHDSPGVTRDRHYGESFWGGHSFNVIDTGGYVPEDVSEINTAIRDQVDLAVDEADVILFIVDAKEGVHPLDRDVYDLLRKLKKPMLFVVNKADNEHLHNDAYEFYELGIDEVFILSAMTGTGTGELLDKLITMLPEVQEENEDEAIPKIAIVGRPNSGKSSLVNALLDSPRTIVSDIAGTTRDTIHTKLVYEGKDYMLLDTAGLRRRTKVKESIEFYSNVRTDKAIKECTVAVIMIDVERGVESQDIKIISEAERFNKGIIIALNKWDTVSGKETNTFRDIERSIQEKIPTLSYIPIISISALTKQRLPKLMELVDSVLLERSKKIKTSDFNEFLKNVMIENPLPHAHHRPLKLNYATQAKSSPPVFIFFMNNPKELPSHYRRYLESKIRQHYGFMGVPITMTFREK